MNDSHDTRRMRARRVMGSPVSWKAAGLSGLVGLVGVAGAIEYLVSPHIVATAEAHIRPAIEGRINERIKSLWERYRDLDARLRAAEVKIGRNRR